MKCGLCCFVVVILLTVLCCAPRRIELEPTHVPGQVRAEQAAIADDTAIDPDLPAKELFRLGHLNYDGRLYDLALKYFLALVERHPESGFAGDSAYNAGLLLQRDGKWERAIELYSMVLSSFTKNSNKNDARFRILACLYELERWDETRKMVLEIRESGARLDADDELELSARDAAALYRLGEVRLSESLLSAAFQDYKIGLRRGDVINEYPGAMAAYYLGLIERDRYKAVELSLASKSHMEKQFENKARHLQAAQDFFVRSIEQDNAAWATASGYQIAWLYRDFYRSFREVDLPEEIAENSEEAIMYECLLQRKVHVLLRKAMKVYDRTLEIGERLRVNNRWIEKSKLELEEIKKLYLAEDKACEDVLPAP